MTRRLRVTLFIGLTLLASSHAFAQQISGTELPAKSQPVSYQQQIASEQEKLALQLNAAKAALESVSAEGQEPPETLTREIELLNRLDVLYKQILAAHEHATELEASKAQLVADLDNLRVHGPAEPRPFAFRLLESLRDQLATETTRERSLADAIEAVQSALSAAKLVQEQKERARRQAKEALETNQDEDQRPALSVALRIAQLGSRAAAQEVRLRQTELENQRFETETQKLRVMFLQEKIDLIASDVLFSQQELDTFLAQIDEEEYRVKQALEWASVDLGVRDAQWLDARQRLDASPAREPAVVEEVDARRLARQARQREVALLGQQLQALAESRKVWGRRHQTFNQRASGNELSAWETETRQSLAQLERDLRLHSRRLTELRTEAATLQSSISASPDAAPGVSRWREEQQRQLGSLIRIHEDTINRLESAQRLHEKLLSQISAEVETVTWGERLSAFWSTVIGVWNYEITTIQDNPITVRKILIGIILLVVGLLLSRVATNMLGRRLLPRLGLNENAAAAIQSLLFYVLVLTVTMLSFRIVNVPLTAFTILGGALAIGIGFGSQNIMNNFISGLILLAERPIRVGDLIEIEELIGIVARIGPRSTRVRSPENMDIIVPNSSFLEKNVVNWTLTDDRYRTHIIVGVVYGSPTREVTRLIRKALDEHGKVLPKPEPIVLFSDFGDNALIFEAHFWVRMRRIMDRRIVESDIRYMVDALFREAGIVIAFPQRDVHLDSREPIRVQFLQNSEAREATEASAAMAERLPIGGDGP
ncbi:MAG: mechanosensitive ion channel [Phycisphaerales bacterium]|nr:MAG: mechanosensitive ion channel [Phycisphaerales bacterium]